MSIEFPPCMPICMLFCPEQNQTSPKTMLSKNAALSPCSTTMMQASPFARSSSYMTSQMNVSAALDLVLLKPAGSDLREVSRGSEFIFASQRTVTTTGNVSSVVKPQIMVWLWSAWNTMPSQ